ncbi:MAG TPA: nucleotidyltransferase family protein [Gemmatimonadaceae bacterium]|nr:nucleotidyltransferase family protein [Gemmatimonadaceae bacterium]
MRSAAGGTTKAVILARGLGTRMRADSPGTTLNADQASVAETGMKAMIPIGRPFLDYVLSALADAGFTEVCLVIGPEHSQVRHHYGRDNPPTRIKVHFAEQPRPLGTADAVLAAERFTDGDTFVVLNSDNYYPPAVLAELSRLREPALVAFAHSALMELGNVSAVRVKRFGALDIDADGYLRRILATPDESMLRQSGEVYGSLNCWLFDNRIFAACREVPLSPRNELELPQAVQLAIERRGMRMKAIKVRAPVLDMSNRADIAVVEERLRDVEVSL